MFKIAFSKKAMAYIHEKNKAFNKDDLNKYVLAIFFYSGGSWTTAFCGNIFELVEKYKIFEDKSEFQLWEEMEGNPDVEVYIETELISEFLEKELIIIDVAIGQLKGEQVSMFFIKQQKDVYGW